MATFKIFRETTLPASLQPYAIYLIAPQGQPNYVEMYVTDSTGSATRRIPNAGDIETLIDTKIAQANELTIVADISARDALSPNKSVYVYVEDASADTTVSSGGATYLYKVANSSWIKTSESESLDVALNWTSLQGKPSSTPAQIDTAVGQAHTHANKTELDNIGEDSDGDLTYNGQKVVAWGSTGW